MARGSHLEIELARDHAAAGMKSHVVGLKHKEKLLECPFAVHVHVQLRCRVLGGSHEPQSEQGAVLDLVSAFSFGGDGLVRVTDFLTPIEHSPPFFHFFSDAFYSTQHDGGRGSPKLALEKQKIHQAPEEHDSDANGALNKHDVKTYAKGKEPPKQCQNTVREWKIPAER
jgi:hypothetical protein